MEAWAVMRQKRHADRAAEGGLDDMLCRDETLTVTDGCYRDPDSPDLPFLQIADIVQSRIAHGLYTGKLPGIDALAEELGFGRGTVAKAYRTLRAEEWITLTPTRGYYVNRRRPGYAADPSAHRPQD